MNQDIDTINSMPVEDDSINNDIAEDCNRLFQNHSWSENSLEESSSGDEDINDAHLDIGNNNENYYRDWPVDPWK